MAALPAIVVTACAALLVGGCGESSVAPSPPSSSTSAAPSPSPNPSPSAPPPLANPADYASPSSRYPQWGFVSPSGEWICVIATAPSNGDRAACALNPDEGPLRFENMPPAQVPDPGGDPSKPNVIAVMESADAGFLSLGRTIWEAGGTPKALPPGTVLEAGGFRCNATESAVSCRDDATGKGFSVSPEGYVLAYVAPTG